MKNLPTISELKERMRRLSETTDWLLEDAGSYNTALGARREIGPWPKKLVKTCVVFDPDETRTYGQITGAKLSRLAVRLVLTANHEHRFLKVLRGITAAVIGPLVAYLRVNLAMTRLEEVMDKICHSALDAGPREALGDIESDNFEAPHQVRGDRRGKPAFTWSQSPRKVYGFAQAKEEYGFDPRDTSVYWIEKRASRLRRKWERYGKENLSLEPSFESRDFVPPQDEGVGVLPDKDGMSALPDSDDLSPPSIPHAGEVRSAVSKQGEGIQDSRLQPSFESRRFAPPQDEERGESGDGKADIPVRQFIPVDADYNTIWPPMELPDEPPKPPRSMDQSPDIEPGIHAEKTAVMREVSPVDAIFLDGDEVTSSPIPHAEEQRSSPTKQGKENLCLQPSFESPGFARPQDEDLGMLRGKKNLDVANLKETHMEDTQTGNTQMPDTPHLPALYTNRKARRAERRSRKKTGRAPP